MAITYSTAIQDQIAIRLAGVDYDDLSPTQQTAIDGQWASGSLTTGHAYEALQLVNRYANFLEVDLTAAPDHWLSWFIWETVWRASLHVETERSEAVTRHRVETMRAAISTHTRSGHEETNQTQGWVINHANIRGHILDECVRLDPPYLPSPEQVDAAMRTRFVMFWGYTNWTFRRKEVELTIGTDSSVTPDPVVTIDSVASSRLFYDDTDGKGRELVHVNATEMSRLKSLGYDAGRPERFRVTKSAGTLVWSFDRTPDQEYTVRGEVVIALPALATSANFDTALGLVPEEMLDFIRMAATADVVSKGMGGLRGRQLREEVREIWDDTLGRLDSTGEPTRVGAESDVRRVFHEQFAASAHQNPVVGGNL